MAEIYNFSPTFQLPKISLGTLGSPDEFKVKFNEPMIHPAELKKLNDESNKSRGFIDHTVFRNNTNMDPHFIPDLYKKYF